MSSSLAQPPEKVKHIDIIRQGVSVWNAWRRKNPKIEANLRRANLRRANLRRADLSGADLSGANLRGANLSDADLSRANLRRADLRWTDLSDADLSGANLRGAELSGANLSRANLRGADLRWARLRDADLSGAELRGADLSGATGDFLTFRAPGGHDAIATCTHVSIGCEFHTPAEWLDRGEEIGRENGYSPQLIGLYRQFVEMAMAALNGCIGGDQ